MVCSSLWNLMVASPMFLLCRCSRLLKQVGLFLLWLRSIVIQGSGCYVRHSHTAPRREEGGSGVLKSIDLDSPVVYSWCPPNLDFILSFSLFFFLFLGWGCCWGRQDEVESLQHNNHHSHNMEIVEAKFEDVRMYFLSNWGGSTSLVVVFYILCSFRVLS